MRKGISVDHLSVSRDNIKILKDISFQTKPGSVVAIIGPSGVGKTTLLRCINRLTPYQSGTVMLGDQDILKIDENLLREKVGLVFQEWHLWPNKTILENITEAPRFVLGMKKSKAQTLAKKLAKKVGLEEKLDKYPDQLSGGQKQRVAIARALSMDPEVLMFDEITSSLDPLRVAEVLDLIATLKSKDRILILATHHIEFAKAVANQVLFLWKGQVWESGKARKILNKPKTKELKNFLKELKEIS